MSCRSNLVAVLELFDHIAPLQITLNLQAVVVRQLDKVTLLRKNESYVQKLENSD